MTVRRSPTVGVVGLTAVAPGVFVLAAYGSWVFLLVGGGLGLVDTGRRGGTRRILQTLASAGYQAEELMTLIITHHHMDHIGSLAALREATGAQVAAHTLEAPLIAGVVPRPNPFRPPLLARALQPIVAWSDPHPAPVDLVLEDGDSLPGLDGWQVLHTPGHTPGSISLWHAERGVLIAGDALELRRGRLAPPSRLFTADMAQAKASIGRLAELDIKTLCLSHFPPVSDGATTLLRALARSFEKH